MSALMPMHTTGKYGATEAGTTEAGATEAGATEAGGDGWIPGTGFANS